MLNAQPDDIFQVSALAALKLLSAGVEALVRITGDIPPTPPPTTPHISNMRGMQAEKESIVRNYSEKSLSRMGDLGRKQDAGNTPGPSGNIGDDTAPQSSPNIVIPTPTRPFFPTTSSHSGQSQTPQPIDGVRLRAQTTSPDRDPSPSGFRPPPPPRSSPEPYIVIGDNSQPLNLQHSAITRKFYSKKPPPIGISDYLLRIHRFCPMSTAVYLATSLYIHRLAIDERAVAVTKRNAHRLLLAGLRVAMKALEDLSYPHSKMAKVGGVSDVELARLEISFCFLCGFELRVRREVLEIHWMSLKNGPELRSIAAQVDGVGAGALPGMTLARLPRPRNLVQAAEG